MPKFAKGSLRRFILTGGQEVPLEMYRDRQVGNTTAILLESIVNAIRNPNREVQVIDHIPMNGQRSKIIYDRLKQMIITLELNNLEVKRNGSIVTIMFSGAVEISEADLSIIKYLANSKVGDIVKDILT